MFKHIGDPTVLTLYLIAAFTYVIFEGHLIKMLVDDRNAKALDDPTPYRLPHGYFKWLGISVTTMFINGLVIGDGFITLSRGSTLFVAVMVSILLSCGKIIEWRAIRWKIWAFFATVIMGGTVWFEAVGARDFLYREENHFAVMIINGLVVGTYVAFMIFGQAHGAKQVWQDVRGGRFNFGGFFVQIARFVNFVIQAYLYTVVDMQWGVAVSSALGAAGAFLFICSYLWRARFKSKSVELQPDAV